MPARVATYSRCSSSAYLSVSGLRFMNDNQGGSCENFAGVFFNGADNISLERNEIGNNTQHGVFADTER